METGCTGAYILFISNIINASRLWEVFLISLTHFILSASDTVRITEKEEKRLR